MSSENRYDMHEFLRVEMLPEKRLIGMSLKMSFSVNKTRELWQNFMPVRSKIEGRVGADLYAIQIYNAGHFEHFNPSAVFEKWAAVEVETQNSIPDGMHAFTIPSGLYAVFFYKGLPSAGSVAFQYIFQEWLPASVYFLDDRPHFEVLGSKYKNEDPDSEEEIWIPVKLKNQPI